MPRKIKAKQVQTNTDNYDNNLPVTDDDVQKVTNTVDELPTGGGGSSSFVGLTDTPSDYEGKAGQGAKVNASENGLEFGFFPVDLRQQSTWYVHPDAGDDTDGDGSAQYPYKTLQKAHDEAGDYDVIIIQESMTALGDLTLSKNIVIKGMRYSPNIGTVTFPVAEQIAAHFEYLHINEIVDADLSAIVLNRSVVNNAIGDCGTLWVEGEYGAWPQVFISSATIQRLYIGGCFAHINSVTVEQDFGIKNADIRSESGLMSIIYNGSNKITFSNSIIEGDVTINSDFVQSNTVITGTVSVSGTHTIQNQGVGTFLDLIDTPPDYSGHQGKLVKVNATEDGIIFGDPSGTTVSWGDIAGTLANQTDLQNALDAKSNTGHGHEITDVDGLQATLDNKEPWLGDPDSDGQILSSTSSGVRSWIDPPMGSTVAWGGITGTLSDQTDLQDALDAKADSGHGHAISDVSGLQDSLDGKVNRSGDTMTGILDIIKNITAGEDNEYHFAIGQQTGDYKIGFLSGVSSGLPGLRIARMNKSNGRISKNLFNIGVNVPFINFLDNGTLDIGGHIHWNDNNAPGANIPIRTGDGTLFLANDGNYKAASASMANGRGTTVRDGNKIDLGGGDPVASSIIELSQGDAEFRIEEPRLASTDSWVTKFMMKSDYGFQMLRRYGSDAGGKYGFLLDCWRDTNAHMDALDLFAFNIVDGFHAGMRVALDGKIYFGDLWTVGPAAGFKGIKYWADYTSIDWAADNMLIPHQKRVQEMIDAGGGGGLTKNTWFVSSTGSTSGSGSHSSPFDEVQKAHDAASAGDVVVILSSADGLGDVGNLNVSKNLKIKALTSYESISSIVASGSVTVTLENLNVGSFTGADATLKAIDSRVETSGSINSVIVYGEGLGGVTIKGGVTIGYLEVSGNGSFVCTTDGTTKDSFSLTRGGAIEGGHVLADVVIADSLKLTNAFWSGDVDCGGHPMSILNSVVTGNISNKSTTDFDVENQTEFSETGVPFLQGFMPSGTAIERNRWSDADDIDQNSVMLCEQSSVANLPDSDRSWIIWTYRYNTEHFQQYAFAFADGVNPESRIYGRRNDDPWTEVGGTTVLDNAALSITPTKVEAQNLHLTEGQAVIVRSQAGKVYNVVRIGDEWFFNIMKKIK